MTFVRYMHVGISADEYIVIQVYSDGQQMIVSKDKQHYKDWIASHEIELIPFVAPEPPSDKELWEQIRLERNRLLQDTDWCLISDSKFSNDSVNLNLILAYRKALRDLPQTYESPKDVVYPQLPECL
jgi:hypothetical protein